MKWLLLSVYATASLLAESIAVSAADPAPEVESRPAANQVELRYWLDNLVRYHGFTDAEASAATGLPTAAVRSQLDEWNIKPQSQKGRKSLLVLPWPAESGKYERADQYIPTETAIAPNGDIFVADGYGLQYILHYNAKGELLHVFGGRGEGDQFFDNAHGICLDTREAGSPTLLITARMQNKLKRFSLGGELMEVIPLPGAYICRPVVHGKHVYLATLVSQLPMNSGTGFVTILGPDNKVVSAPGGSAPEYDNKGKLSPLHQVLKIFQHPHDVCVDDEENLYVAQWNSGKTYPIKLERV